MLEKGEEACASYPMGLLFYDRGFEAQQAFSATYALICSGNWEGSQYLLRRR